MNGAVGAPVAPHPTGIAPPPRLAGATWMGIGIVLAALIGLLAAAKAGAVDPAYAPAQLCEAYTFTTSAPLVGTVRGNDVALTQSGLWPSACDPFLGPLQEIAVITPV